MKTGIRLWLLSATLLALIALAVYVPVRYSNRQTDETCRRITAVATDHLKMRYVRDWAVSRLSDPHFIDAVRQSPSFEQSDPRVATYIDLDWTRLGLRPDRAWIEFNVKSVERHTVTASGIESLSLHEARNTIIVNLRGEVGLNLEWPPEALTSVKPVGHGVFVSCE